MSKPDAGALKKGKKKKAKIGVLSGLASTTSTAAQGKKTGGGSKKSKGSGSKSDHKSDKSGDHKQDQAKGSKTGGHDDFADESVENNSDTEEDYSDDGEEGEDGYKVGGYHPVSVGDKFNNYRYTVIEKLGWGHFSTVWMVHDRKPERKTPEFVAIKVQKSAPHYRDAAFDEIELLNCVSHAATAERAIREFGPDFDPCVVTLLDHFEHSGPHGKHVCMVFEMLGENLLKVIQKYDYRGIPIAIVRDFARQICVGLDFLHRHCSIIHTDLKPENILVARAPLPPSRERVQELIAMNEFAKSSKAAKANGGATLSDLGACGGTARGIEALTKQLESEKTLSTEQRKKLKKKLKKKRQKEKKKETKRRGNRRKGDRSSMEKDKKKEMLMMEKDSNVIPSGKIEAKADKASAKLRSLKDSQTELEIVNRLAALSIELDVESKRESDSAEEALTRAPQGRLFLPTTSSPPSSSAKPVLESGEAADYGSDDECNVLLPAWTRPTLFSFLNFRKNDASLRTRTQKDKAALYTKFSRIAEDDCIKNSDVMFSEIVMLTSTSRLMEAFGPPANSFEEDAVAFSGWFLALSKSRYASAHDERADAADPSLNFKIKGQGFDSDGIFSLVGSCLLNAVAFQPDSYSIVIPQNDEDRPVSWTITHHASITEHLILFLEHHIEGLRFLSHYKIPSCLCEEDDAELLYALQRDCHHPASRGNHEPTQNRLFAQDKKDMGDEDLEGLGDRPFTEGQGAILGVDLDSLMASIVGETEMDETYLISIYDIDSYVRPLDERMRAFIGDCVHLEETISEFNTMGQALLLAAGELSNEGSIDGDGDNDSVAEGRGKSRPERYDKFDDEFRGVNLKIVDLGNACWTYKHFTDDIQTRQYRCPEVLLGGQYDTSADIWSLACIIFELITGELLFDPRAGKTWDREEDHLAMMIELLGNFPMRVITGKNKDDYFTKSGSLKHIHHLKFWGLKDVLHEKYKLDIKDAAEIASFLGPMLELDPNKRATALECLQHPWVVDCRAKPKNGGGRERPCDFEDI